MGDRGRAGGLRGLAGARSQAGARSEGHRGRGVGAGARAGAGAGQGGGGIWNVAGIDARGVRCGEATVVRSLPCR